MADYQTLKRAQMERHQAHARYLEKISKAAQTEWMGERNQRLHSQLVDADCKRSHAKLTMKAKTCLPPPPKSAPYNRPNQQQQPLPRPMPQQAIVSGFQLAQMQQCRSFPQHPHQLPQQHHLPQQQHLMYAQQQLMLQQHWATNGNQMPMPHYFPPNSFIPMNFPMSQPNFPIPQHQYYPVQEAPKLPVTLEFETTSVEDIDPFNEGDVDIKKYLDPVDITIPFN
ncbi:hypothetical protein M3Y94_00402900 [Aphelenchoides besseyi]|nr:hypothetical protein M3Y94_00402900 [Aphelenchoides besseyi]